MLESTILLAKAVILALPGAWLVTGAYDNFRHPTANLSSVDRVLRMIDVEAEYPEIWRDYQKRSVSSPRLVRALFYLIAASEALVAAWMLISVGLLIVASFGGVPTNVAYAMAIGSTAAFTAIWGAFLIGGNWFHYWMPESNPQKTHFFMTLWGLGTLIVILP